MARIPGNPGTSPDWPFGYSDTWPYGTRPEWPYGPSDEWPFFIGTAGPDFPESPVEGFSTIGLLIVESGMNSVATTRPYIWDPEEEEGQTPEVGDLIFVPSSEEILLITNVDIEAWGFNITVTRGHMGTTPTAANEQQVMLLRE
jgi:hypothetical protein